MTVDARLGALVASLLEPETVPARAVTDREMKTILGVARSQRVVGWLAEAVASGAQPATDVQVAMVVDEQRRAAASVLRLERLLLDVDDALRGAGVTYRVLKGPVLARTAYPDTSLRHYGDIDVLVRTGTVARAIGVLVAMGAARPVAPLRPGFDDRFGKGATLLMSDGHEIDVHRTFVAGPLGFTIDLDELFANDDVVSLGGRALPCLAPTHRFVHACFAVALDPAPRLASAVDVASLVLAEELDEAAVLAAAERWEAAGVVARALRLTWDRIPLRSSPPLLDWARAQEPSRRDRRRLDAYIGGDRSYARRAIAAVGAVPGVTGKAAYARSLLLPAPEHLGGRSTSGLSHVRRGLRHLLGRERAQ